MSIVDNHVIEGHVSPGDPERLSAERPPIRGLTVPGMPGASPGGALQHGAISLGGTDGRREGRLGTFPRHPAQSP